MPSSSDDLSRRNKQAWSQLYASNVGPVWGQAPAAFLEKFLQPLLAGNRRFARALDAATGEGRNLPVLARLAAHVTGCDAAPEALAKIPPGPAGHDVRLICTDLAATPFAAGEFDFILLSDVIETLPEPRPVLQEMRRVLARDGVIVCNIPGPEDGIAGIDMSPLGGRSFLYRRKFYFQFFDEREAVRLVEDAGFRIVRQEFMHWTEAPHPAFRSDEHTHRSRVFLLARDDAPE